MPLTHFLADDLIEYIKSNYSDTYVSIFTAVPNKSGGGTEVTGGSYARSHVVMADVFATAATSESDSVELVDFPTPTAAWGTPVAIGLHDDPTAGNLLAWYALPPSLQIPIGIGSYQSFPIGNLILRNI